MQLLRALHRRPTPSGARTTSWTRRDDYQQMVEATARALGKRRPMLPVSRSPRDCRVCGERGERAPRALVKPLIDQPQPRGRSRRARTPCMQRAGIPGRSFDESLRSALETRTRTTPRAFQAVSGPGHSDARSVQRLPLPRGFDAEQVARLYESWLVRFLPLLRARKEGEHRVSFYAPPVSRALLTLAYSPSSSSADRALLYVVGGLLARPYDRGRLEFLQVAGRPEVLAARRLSPDAARWIYLNTQRRAHWVKCARSPATSRARPTSAGVRLKCGTFYTPPRESRGGVALMNSAVREFSSRRRARGSASACDAGGGLVGSSAAACKPRGRREPDLPGNPMSCTSARVSISHCVPPACSAGLPASASSCGGS